MSPKLKRKNSLYTKRLGKDGFYTDLHVGAHQHRNLSEKLGDFGMVRGWSLGFTSRLWYLRTGFALCTYKNKKDRKRSVTMALLHSF